MDSTAFVLSNPQAPAQSLLIHISVLSSGSPIGCLQTVWSSEVSPTLWFHSRRLPFPLLRTKEPLSVLKQAHLYFTMITCFLGISLLLFLTPLRIWFDLALAVFKCQTQEPDLTSFSCWNPSAAWLDQRWTHVLGAGQSEHSIPQYRDGFKDELKIWTGLVQANADWGWTSRRKPLLLPCAWSQEEEQVARDCQLPWELEPTQRREGKKPALDGLVWSPGCSPTWDLFWLF